MSRNEVEISVVIPTFERHGYLLKLLRRLCQSSFKKFDVIVVDQSQLPFDVCEFENKLNIQYHHVTFRGAGLARNYGAKYGDGAIIAFTDDDCIPAKDWLEKAYAMFQAQDIVGLEGRIYPERFKTNPQKYRVVSNFGLENVGFMTANLFVRRECFQKVAGFDERFNNPHFREDTDLGWRLESLGEIQFSENVKVLHPSERKKVEENRNHFFTHDALLFYKHPEKYIELFIKEQHYIHNEEFWGYFFQGFERHHIDKVLLFKLLEHGSINLGYIPMSRLFSFIRS
ncbi:glycosyltransferase family 2 protein [Paenibacillus massiliensis]|uniref:glycosyltransferase family 2 protein n=1 Tax=Paenibacillus massiliensis TaxID=225917 RepID=UPI0003734297|nr:glycosyltransferase [Paenibacillus massiliensis]